jgi:hypothetical protein
LKQKDLKKHSLDISAKIENAVSGEEYFSSPYQHIIIDNLIENRFIESIFKAFPKLNDPDWEHTYDEGIEVKSRTNWTSEFDIPDKIIDIIRIFNSSPVLNAIGSRLKIPKLIPDPYFTGGGLNVTPKGGLLDVHVDGNYHDATGLNRRVNLLLYLNKNWKPEWGGELGIYKNQGKTLHTSIAPIFNRCVIFDTHDKSYHGLPNPINFPKKENRKSIILYYYTHATRPKGQILVDKPHSALWKSKKFTDKKGKKVRNFT